MREFLIGLIGGPTYKSELARRVTQLLDHEFRQQYEFLTSSYAKEQVFIQGFKSGWYVALKYAINTPGKETLDYELDRAIRSYNLTLRKDAE